MHFNDCWKFLATFTDFYFSVAVTNNTEFGVHGYDPTVSEMHPFFMARGPKIKKAHKVAPFQTVDLFNLFCEILELPPRPNNGSTKDIIKILTEDGYGVGTVAIIAGKFFNFSCQTLMRPIREIKNV